MKRIIFSSLIFILFLTVFYTCKKEVKDEKWDDTINSGFIRIACDENFKDLMDAEIAVFEAHNPKAFVIPIYTSETEAIRLMLIDSVRFALTTRDLTAKERAELEKKYLRAKKHLIAFDGLALITNKSNEDSILSLSNLKKILSGEITEWAQINQKSSAGTIRVIFGNKESGVLRYAVESISPVDSLSSNIYSLNDNNAVLEKVSQMPNALGVIGVNALSDENSSNAIKYKNKIRLVRISKEETATVKNSYLPYAGDIRQEKYPLWRSVYVILSDPKNGLSSGLSIFLANEVGQKLILKSGLLPITDSQNIQVNIIDEYPK
ncbi:MAG: substrate-binding domain-containing protein [Dysgonamonadaceae bacterium]|jgi:phosphate transport system substrate-binding protein|nr:substrate-binding domain-containing protein [Dysgonamonadaceae bacterium]